jgi:Protein of unknown function (DUF2911)
MTRWFPATVVAGLLLAACADSPPLEQYGFLTRLGQDTIAIERVSRYSDRLLTEAVDRFPQVKQRVTEVDLNPDGSPRRMNMRVTIPSAGDSARSRRIVADFERDTVRVSLTDGAGTRTIAMASGGMLTIPHVPQMYSLYELYFAAALKRAAAEGIPPGGTLTTRQFYPDREFNNYPIPMHQGYVRPSRGDTVEIQHNWLAGTGVAVVDSNQRMLHYSGARTTYLVDVTRLAEPPDIRVIGERFAAAESARGPVTAVSPRDTVDATIGGGRFRVDYGRPLQRGRTLLGDVIPYDRVWRTGANEATHFTTTVPIRLGGVALDAGTYTLWTVPRRDGATLIINRQTGQWGTGYGPAHDVGRTPLTVADPPAPVEQFTISIDSTGPRAGTLSLAWGNFRWTAPIGLE